MSRTFPSRWKAHKLDRLGSVNRGRSRHRPRNDPSLYGGEYPFFQTGDIKTANLYLSHYSQTYNEKGLSQSKQWEPGTLCITIAANIADTAILGIRGCFPDSVIGFISDPMKADVRFIKYYIDFIKLDMQQVSHGTTQDNLSLEKLLSFDFVVPDIEEQRKIAAVLSVYDDLIENNLRRIKILEKMAQNLYREWFVKFRFPGHEKERFVDSSLGRVPEGWEVVTLGEHLVALESGKRPRGGAKELKSGIPSVGAENILGIGRHNYQSEKYVPRKFSEKMKKGVVKDGDVAIYKDGAYIGKSTYFRDSFPHAQFCVNEHVFLLRTTGKRLTQNILYLWLQEPATVSIIRATNANAAQPGINQKSVKRLPFVVPSLEITNQFDQLVEPHLILIISLAKKNEVLRRTRDLLLPKLISGEIDVSNIAIQTAWLPKDKNDISRYDFFRQICRLPFVAKVVLFGSRARGDHHDHSDIDLAVFCDQASDEEWRQVLDCLREDRIDTLLKVDCVHFERSNAALKEHIMIEGKVLYEKNGQQTIEQLKKRKEQIKKMSENKLANHLSNSQRCLKRLDEAIRQPLDEDMFMLDAVVHRFNVAFELLMDTLLVYCVETDFLPEEKIKEYELNARKLIELAFDCKLIDDDQTWIAIKDARNATAHEYDEQQALDHYDKVKSYLPHLQALFEKMNTIHSATPADDVAKDISYSSKNPDADN